jgi:hypothetical protein
MQLRLRWRKTPGHHWKLMTAAIVCFTLCGFLLLMTEHLAAGVAFIVGIATLAVQWFCIDPPYVDEVDLHGTAAKTPETRDPRPRPPT